MKKFLFTFVFFVQVVVNVNAQHAWAMAVIENERPVIVQYHGVPEKAENGVEYLRIYDDGFLFRREDANPIKLQYGYRIGDKRIYVYDYDSKKESLAFDFTLSAGDYFTTVNGMEWVVEDVKDTLVNISFDGSESKRLLSVKTLDGKQSDHWLEDFGSFANHFMINTLENVKFSQTLWMEYELGEYLAREINMDPFYCHDSGWMNGSYNDSTDDIAHTICHYENGKVTIESVQWWYDHRDYTCFYRTGDDIYNLYWWEFNPQIEEICYRLKKDIIEFEGLPDPVSGKYNIHIGNDEYATAISQRSHTSNPNIGIYSLQGRRLQSVPTRGFYIKDGRKKLNLGL